MNNQTLIKAGKGILKSLLANCTPEQQLVFKRMYSANDLAKDINQVVEDMDVNKIDHAITQCENTVEKNKNSF